MNSNWITNLEINNFKSIKHIKMDCKRINVLIGKPNVGKSNILEALSLFEAPNTEQNIKFLENYIRYEKTNQLFYFLERKNPLEVITNLGFASLWHDSVNYHIAISPDSGLLDKIKVYGTNSFQIDPFGFFKANENRHAKMSAPSYYAFFNDGIRPQGQHFNLTGFINPIKIYRFKHQADHKTPFSPYLKPPFGDNLFTIIESNRELWHEFAGFFNEYGFDLLLDLEEEKLFVQRKEGRYVTKLPYSLVADTLQRIIFHLAAIETNKDSVLIFEEPESHSFPPYVSQLAERIIENETNQFFIATHSPYLLTPFIEQCMSDDVAIFIASYENYETKIKALTDEEIDNIMDTGIDLFFNIRAFQK